MPHADPLPPRLPVARVAVDVPLSHLDHPFDYAVLPSQDEAAVVGARVRVRFAGRLLDGFVLERLATSDGDRELSPLHKVVSPEAVLTPEISALIRVVADHYAGTYADVLRLAVPPRHATTEKAVVAAVEPGVLPTPAPPGPLPVYPDGDRFLNALATGRSPRALWQVTPSAAPEADWAAGLAQAARACVEGGRTAVLVAPDQRDVARLEAACVAALGRAAVVALVAEAGPAARYRAFLAALRKKGSRFVREMAGSDK